LNFDNTLSVWISIDKKFKKFKINSVKIKMKGSISNNFDLDVCCQDHNPKHIQKILIIGRSFRKLLTKFEKYTSVFVLKDVICGYGPLRIKLKTHMESYNYRSIRSEVLHGFKTFYTKRNFNPNLFV